MATSPDICRGRHQGNECSEAAHERNQATSDAQRRWILRQVQLAGPAGLTTDELAQAASRDRGYEVPPNRISGRVSELVGLGQLIRTRARRPTRTGSLAAVHILPAFGQRISNIATIGPAAHARLPLAAGQVIAQALVSELRRGCLRIEVAGSLRREAKTVGDIEIVCIPRPVEDLFGQTCGSALDPILAELQRFGRLRFIKNGPRYKRFEVPGRQPTCLDLFLVTTDTWGVQLAIRTGPAVFSRALVTSVSLGGLLREGHRVRDGRVWGPDGRAIATPEERDFLELSGGWREPRERR